MMKMRTVSPHSLQGDLGWHLREAYTEAIEEVERSVLGSMKCQRKHCIILLCLEKSKFVFRSVKLFTESFCKKLIKIMIS